MLLWLILLGVGGWLAWWAYYDSAANRKERIERAMHGATALLVYMALCTAFGAYLAVILLKSGGNSAAPPLNR